MKFLFQFSTVIVLLALFVSCDRKPQDKFKTAVVIDEKGQGFGDGSSWYHFTVNSAEFREYLSKNCKAKGSGGTDLDFEYFWPEEAPSWWHPEEFGPDVRVFRRDNDGITEFFLVNKPMTEAYYQHTER